MNQVELSIGKVELIEGLTWGQQEQIRQSMLEGVKVHGVNERQSLDLDASVISKAKYKALEVCVKKITLNDGTEIAYSREWMDNLSVADGDILSKAVDEVTNPSKK